MGFFSLSAPPFPMLSERHANSVAVWAPAKINLFLEVLQKRADGYHAIETLMVAVNLYDILEFKEEPTGHIALISDHPTLDLGPTNLIVRAARLLQQETGCTRGARIGLTKRIPMAAGLAGGSSDAAATLWGLNELWNLGLGREKLAELSAKIGSDVAFFFSLPMAWCTGRGEIVTPVPLGRKLDFLLVCPPVGLSTAGVYRHVAVPTKPESGDAIRQAAEAGDGEAIGRLLFNRLQEPAERLCPEITPLLRRLVGMDSAGAAMSGSGTTLFALCRNRREAVSLAREIRQSPKAHGLQPMGVKEPPRMFLVRSV